MLLPCRFCRRGIVFDGLEGWNTKHPNYKYLSDSDKRNAFDIERFLSVRLKPKADEVYDVYEVDLSDEEAATA